jgi:hypothetical protein
MPQSLPKLWKMGFGTVHGNNLLSVRTSVVGGVLLANLPQAALSYLYLAFNALYTNMFVAQEWSSYKTTRKPLRVTSPVGQQRNTYWLNVPYRYGIPLMIASTLFHWLASQSLFLVQITVTDARTRAIDESQQISTCGYSPVAIILTTVVAVVLALAGITMATLHYSAGRGYRRQSDAGAMGYDHGLRD